MKMLMKSMLTTAMAVGLASTAQAGLLDDMTTGGASGATAMSADELASVVGEGTAVRFIEIPNLARSFERTFEAGQSGMTVSIVAVAGSGITITLSGANVPNWP